jgi:hypothetical protein
MAEWAVSNEPPIMLSVPIPPPPHVPLSCKHYYSAISPLSLAHITIQRVLYAGTSTVLIVYQILLLLIQILI